LLPRLTAISALENTGVVGRYVNCLWVFRIGSHPHHVEAGLRCRQRHLFPGTPTIAAAEKSGVRAQKQSSPFSIHGERMDVLETFTRLLVAHIHLMTFPSSSGKQEPSFLLSLNGIDAQKPKHS